MGFLTTEASMNTAMFLRKALETDYWHDIKIRLLLSRRGKAGLPIQNLHGSLLSAFCGSYFVDADDLKEVLVLLVKPSANIHDKLYGMIVSDFARKRRASYTLITGDQCTRDLRLGRICSEALSARGYTEAAVWSVLETFKEPEFDSPWLTSSGGFYNHSSFNACERKRNVLPQRRPIRLREAIYRPRNRSVKSYPPRLLNQSKNIKFVQRPARSFTTPHEHSIPEKRHETMAGLNAHLFTSAT